MRVKWMRVLGLFTMLLVMAVANGQEGYYLSLPGKGTASIFLSRSDRVAVVVDGGTARGGIQNVTMHGRPVLDFLHDAKIRDLVIVCSHPHEDHMGGLKRMVQDPRILQFRKITFVDSGYKEGEASASSLKQIYDRAWDTHPKQPSITWLSARGQNGEVTDVLTGVSRNWHHLHVSNFAYTPRNRDPHGNCLITEVELTRNGRSQRVADFDDADRPLQREYVAAVVGSERRSSNVLVAPHHGSDDTDFSPLLNSESRPVVIFTANADNAYRHPRARIVQQCVDAVGTDRVRVTGAADNYVRITEWGVAKKNLSEHRRETELWARQIQRVEELRTKAGGKQVKLDDEIARLRRLHRQWADEPDDGGKPPPLQSDNTGGFTDLATREQEAGQELRDGNRQPVPIQGGSDLPPTSASGGGGAGSSAGGGAARASSFAAAMRLSPLNGFGGVFIGSPSDPHSAIPLRASISGRYGLPVITVTVKSKGNRQATGTFSEMTVTELWAAYRFVAPTQDMRARYGKALDTCGLVGITRNESSYWTFGINPAIANTLLARDAMRLDMALAARESGPQSFSGMSLPEFDTYQWYDVPARISVTGGRVVVTAARGPSDLLMRFRLWSEASEKFIAFETTPRLDAMAADFAPLRRIDQLARTVAILNWLQRAGKLPALPKEGIVPQRRYVPPRLDTDEVFTTP